MSEDQPKRIHLTEELHTPNGSDFGVSRHGSQVVKLVLNHIQVIHPLTRLHAIGAPRLTAADTDLSPEQLEAKTTVGETVGDAGSWWSFDDDHEQAQIKPLPMHSPASAPFTTYKSIPATPPFLLAMTAGGAENKTFAAFFGDNKYTVTRAFAVTETSGRDTATISTTIRNVGEQLATTPSGTEHSYYETDTASAFLLADGRQKPINDFLKPRGHTGYNDMDQRIKSSEISGRPGMLAFVNADGHIVVINAMLTTPNGEMPVENWAVYRQHKDDPYTAMEPLVGRTQLQAGESYTLNVVITTYASIEEFKAAQAT